MEKNKKTKNRIKYSTGEGDEIKNLLLVILIVVIIVGALYLATRLFVTKDLFKKEEPEVETVTPGSISYDKIIMGQLLNRPYNEYYVAIYDASKGDYIIEMMSLVSNYNQAKNHLHIYTVDLSNKLNEEYYDPDKVNVDAKSLDDIKVGDITLIKVKKGAIVKYIVDLEKMEKELGLSK